jgi:hypothetical protein
VDEESSSKVGALRRSCGELKGESRPGAISEQVELRRELDAPTARSMDWRMRMTGFTTLGFTLPPSHSSQDPAMLRGRLSMLVCCVCGGSIWV